MTSPLAFIGNMNKFDDNQGNQGNQADDRNEFDRRDTEVEEDVQENVEQDGRRDAEVEENVEASGSGTYNFSGARDLCPCPLLENTPSMKRYKARLSNGSQVVSSIRCYRNSLGDFLPKLAVHFKLSKNRIQFRYNIVDSNSNKTYLAVRSWDQDVIEAMEDFY